MHPYRNFRVGLFCAVLLLNVVITQAQTPPSAKMLLDGWRAYSQSFASQIHSYHLEGQAQSEGEVNVGSPFSEHWSSTLGGKRYLYQMVDDTKSPAIAVYDGKEWFIYEGSSRQFSTLTRSEKIGDNSIKYEFEMSAFKSPFNIQKMIDSPFPMHLDVPAYQYYMQVASHMTVTGPETIAGADCYHLHLPDRYITSEFKDRNLPQDVWLAIHKNMLLPWRLTAEYQKGIVRNTTTLTTGQDYGQTWLPTGYTCLAEFGGKKQKWVQGYLDHVTLTVTDINKAFPDSAFHYSPPKGSELYVDGRMVSPPASIAASSQSLVSLRILLAIAFLVAFVRLCFMYRKRHSPMQAGRS